MDYNSLNKTEVMEKYLTRKRLLGLLLGLVLAIIVLNVDKNLWWPFELATVNNRNTGKWLTQNKPSTKNIIVILFDDKTQFLLRQNGMPIKDFEKKGRDLINQAINKLEESKVKAIGLNLNLNNPSDARSDTSLIKTISKYNNIVIADSLHSSPSYQPRSVLQNTKAVGYGELYADYDGIVHKIKPIDKEYKNISSFSYALYKMVSNFEAALDLKNKNEFYIRYPNESIEKYSFIDLIEGRLDLKTLNGKIVILGIGLNSKLMKDKLVTPFYQNVFISDSEVQAVSLANLLSSSYLFSFSVSNYPFHIVIFSMILGLMFCSVSVLRGLVIGSVLFLSEVIVGQGFYNYGNLLIELVPLMVILFGNYMLGALIYSQLNLQEQNLELVEALSMLSVRSKELENSTKQLAAKNQQLSSAFSEINEKMGELKEVRKLLSTKSEDERKRIARELHDDTLARITDLRIYIEAMINSSNMPVAEKKQLGASIQILDNVTSEIRRIINALRPSMLDTVLGLIPSIENLLDQLSKRSMYKIQCQLKTSISKLKLPENAEINLYRIVQEALNNILKHSNATKVEILITEQPGQILFLVHDNGIGFKKDTRKKGFGLIDMRERAELIGASLQYLNRLDDGGTTLEITIPKDIVLKIERGTKILV